MPSRFAWRAGLHYGLLGWPLAFAALPLYVVLPNYYALRFDLSLATLGFLLLCVRMFDAGIEPVLGRISDALFHRSPIYVLASGVGLALAIWIGMLALLFPPDWALSSLGAWLFVCLLLTSAAHSLLTIVHQAWGVRLGGDELQRGKVVAWREGFGLLGVIMASALSLVTGPSVMLAVFALAWLVGFGAWRRAPVPGGATHVGPSPVATGSAFWAPLRVAAFRRLLLVFTCNGIASAVPAALMLFFAQDRLRASEAATALFLVLYFLAGALSMPLWLGLVRRIGLARSWLLSMLLAVLCFAWTATLGTGDIVAFAVICACTGIALGADLAFPGALLARLIEAQGAQGVHDGAYLGWWSLATKLNLALAAGVSLPLLECLGYVPGSRDELFLQHLTWAYALLPCLLKIGAATLLYRLVIRRQPDSVI